MNPEQFEKIESALWKSLLDLTEENRRSGEYLRGYFSACEDLASIMKKLERRLNPGAFPNPGKNTTRLPYPRLPVRK